MIALARIRSLHRAALVGAALLLVACASAPLEPSSPLLRLSPASLGQALALQQQLTVDSRGQTQSLDVILEVDAQAVRLAAMNLGQTAARLEWDGTTLSEARAPWWPAAIGGERILSDLQLMLWPSQAISAALPAGWALQSEPHSRVLSQQGKAVIQVRYLSKTQSELVHLRDGYRIRVDSRTLGGMQ